MARIPKPKKKKEPKPSIIEVPLLAVDFAATSAAAKQDIALCDKCRKEVPFGETTDTWMLGLALNPELRLVIGHWCPDCFPELEWGKVYCPNPRPGAFCMPLGMS